MVEAAHFSFSRAADGGGLLLRLWGELDPVGAQALASGMADVSFDGLAEVRVDCGDLTFLDSSGIAVLLQLRDRAAAVGAWFALDHLPDTQRRILGISGLLELLQVDEDLPPHSSAPG